MKEKKIRVEGGGGAGDIFVHSFSSKQIGQKPFFVKNFFFCKKLYIIHCQVFFGVRFFNSPPPLIFAISGKIKLYEIYFLP